MSTSTLSPATIAAFKRAMVPGTRIHIDNALRPVANRYTVVLPKTNSVNLVTAHPGAERGSHLRWPKKGMVAHDGDTWALLDDAGDPWLTITVLP